MEHKSVLLHETVDLLNVKPDGIYVDGTLGRAGHAKLLCSRLANGHLYAFDKDEEALTESKQVLEQEMDKVTFIHASFADMKKELAERGVTKVDGVMMDLGVSSPQFDDPRRGFSYRFDARLDMRMDQTQSLTACKVVNTYSYEDLCQVLWKYGEERYARQIAREIVKRREEKPIETTFQLVDIIKAAKPEKELRKKGHPAKQTFQALRIEVNDELNALSEGVEEACELLNLHGRCCIITFQSLEDRIVKTVFRRLSSAPSVDPRIPIKASQMEQASFTLLNKKPITAGEEELNENHRAHSAKLRGIERVRVGSEYEKAE